MAVSAVAARLAQSAASGAGGAGIVTQLFPPAQVTLERESFGFMPNRIPTFAELIALRRFGNMPEAEYTKLSRENGLDIEFSKRSFEASQQLLSANEYVSLKRRGIISEQTLNDHLGKLGFTPDEFALVVKSSDFIPGPQDLIRFAVREVFSQGERQALGLDQDFPPAFLREAEKVGLSPDDAKNFWAAHWQLPSVTQGFEMLHRELITKEELFALLKAQDYAPVWREKLLGISYNHLTRVDVRRMFQIGVLDKDGVEKAYRTGGYSPEDAKFLAEFVSKDVRAETQGLTQAKVLKAFSDGLNSREETVSMLKKMGLKEDVIAFDLEIAEFDRLKNSLADDLVELQAQFSMGLVTEDQIRGILKGLGAPDGYIDQQLAKILRSQSTKVKLPSRTDLERWFEKQLISEEMYFTGMLSLGYKRSDAQLYMAEILHDNENHKRKFLSVEKYTSWLKSGILSQPEWMEIGKAMGVDPADIQRVLTSVSGGGAK